MPGYWDRLASSRPTRRRFVAGLGATAVAAALAACSSPHHRDSDPTPAASSRLISYPEDTTSSALNGGTFKGVSHGDVTTFDPLAAGSGLVNNLIAGFTYPRLLKFTGAKYPALPTGDVEGDLAESFELAPDRLTLTFKLRQGLKWEGRPPTNGRAIDAGDVVFSWSKFAKFSPLRGDFQYHPDLGPAAPVDSVSSPDPRTVVFKLKQPDASLLADFAADRYLYIMPRESDGGFDPRIEVRGYGPWIMDQNKPGAFRSWRRNADYHVKGRPFYDSIEMPVIGDYMARLGQFKAGNVWSSVVSQEDVLTTKRTLPSTLLRQADNHATTAGSLSFGYDGNSPWRDDRLRQAVSMSIDRETLVNLNSNRSRFLAEGLPVDIRYHTAVAAGWEGAWIDPTSADFGANGRYFSHDPDEAHKLLAAAGYSDGIDTFLHYAAGSQYGVLYTRTAELDFGHAQRERHPGRARPPRLRERLAAELRQRLHGRPQRRQKGQRLSRHHRANRHGLPDSGEPADRRFPQGRPALRRHDSRRHKPAPRRPRCKPGTA